MFSSVWKNMVKCKKLRIYIYVNEQRASNLAQSVVVFIVNSVPGKNSATYQSTINTFYYYIVKLDTDNLIVSV